MRTDGVKYNAHTNKYQVIKIKNKTLYNYGTWDTEQEARYIAIELYKKRNPMHLSVQHSTQRGRKYRQELCQKLSIPLTQQGRIPEYILQQQKRIITRKTKTAYEVGIAHHNTRTYIYKCKTLKCVKKKKKTTGKLHKPHHHQLKKNKMGL